jgi:6-phosphofructokinase 2
MYPRIVTLTLNPAVDTAFEADRVIAGHKIRTHNETHDPGGGGVNVARVLTELGVEASAVVLAGGVTGAFLVELLEQYGVPCRPVRIAGTTRFSTTVHDRATGEEYRFVPEGPEISAADVEAAITALDTEPGDWIVLSGSLPRGAPADTYARIAERESARGRHVVLDTSGAPLRAALGHGLALIKPSERELEDLVGPIDPEAAARDLVRSGAAERVAVSMGADGALIATAAGVIRRPAIPVEARGAVGAGDSFLAAMTLALATGCDAEDALLWGLAAGAGAVSQTGTAHPRRADVIAFYRMVRRP